MTHLWSSQCRFGALPVDDKFRSQRAHFFCISPPPGYLCGPYFKVTARTNNGNPAVLFSQRYKPHLANWQKMCLNSTFFRYSARSPHRATKPSRGWLRVGGRKPRFVLSNADPTRNKVTAKRKDRRPGVWFWSGRALATGTAWASLVQLTISCLAKNTSAVRR